MTIELSEEQEKALRAKANAGGLSLDAYVFELLEIDLKMEQEPKQPLVSFKTGYGMWAKYGTSLSEEEIDENRADMMRNFADDR